MTQTRQGTVIYGRHKITYRLSVARRKTMEIAVLPDCSVVVKVPPATDIAAAEEKIYKRASWIIKQQRFFEQFTPRTPPRCYLSGETHLYLGRQYRLKVLAAAGGEAEAVQLTRGYFYVHCRRPDDTAAVRRLIEKWYSLHARQQFDGCLSECWQRFDETAAAKPQLIVRKLQKRWGSLSAAGRLVLNSELIQAPKACIEYVIMHELCHLQYPNHGRDFYKLLEEKLPQWQKLKQRLELCLR